MATQLYICKQCGCPDLMMPKSNLVLDANDKVAECPNCKWKGPLKDAAGIYTTEKIYDTKAVLDLLLHVTTKHAAGPIAQALIFIGMIEADDQEALDKVMRAATEGLIRETFMAAAEHAAAKGKDAALRIEDIHIVTGAVDPGWQERELTAMPERKRALNVIWEEFLKARILGLLGEKNTDHVKHFEVPHWLHSVLYALQDRSEDEPVLLLGCKVYASRFDDTDRYAVVWYETEA